jgi:hypothetical protein
VPSAARPRSTSRGSAVGIFRQSGLGSVKGTRGVIPVHPCRAGNTKRRIPAAAAASTSRSASVFTAGSGRCDRPTNRAGRARAAMDDHVNPGERRAPVSVGPMSSTVTSRLPPAALRTPAGPQHAPSGRRRGADGRGRARRSRSRR